MRPFIAGDLFLALRSNIESILDEINMLENEYILNTAMSELEEYYMKMATVQPIILLVDQKQIASQEKINYDVSGDFRRAVSPGKKAFVSGTLIQIEIPYSGDPKLWELKATTYSMERYPDIDIRDNAISFSIAFPDDSVDEGRVQNEVDENIDRLIKGVGYSSDDVKKHNDSLKDKILPALEKRKKEAQTVQGIVASLGIPLKRVDKAPAFLVPLKRRKLSVTRPKAGEYPYNVEPFIDEVEYQHILSVMKSMSLVIERNPFSFSSLNEETIRDHFLIQLNGHYKGKATGETFNACGKTDIIIRENDKNVFIAECKFWHGQESIKKAMYQLLSYLTWRDSKCALLVFNRNKDAKGVIQKMHESMKSLPECKKIEHHNTEGDSRYIFVKDSEPGKEIIITSQLYNIPLTNQ